MRLNWKKTPGRPRAWLALVLLPALLLAPGVAAVADTAAPNSLDQAVAQVERDHAGRVLSARGERRNGGVVYTIRLLTEDQQVRTFEVEGAEGARP
ncbi:PepSY domain-containing protein [Thioalkalivibrio sp.]|uniref:PepSY domain-containing protein n=1 Tax=Thioalkalivibrio sp. TaxID=2093813 RepID=UPI003974EFE8